MTAALKGGEWSAARPGRTLPPGKTRCPLYRRLGGPQGRSGRAENSHPHGDSIPDRPAYSQSLYRLSYPVQFIFSAAYSMSVEHVAIRISAVSVSFVVIARAHPRGVCVNIKVVCIVTPYNLVEG